MRQALLFISILMTMEAQAQQTDYHFSCTDSTSAASGKIWEVWTDVANWKQWDKGLKDATLYGPFVVGSKGKITPDKGPQSKFVISDVDPFKSYTFKTKIPFGWLIIKRTLAVKGNTTFFTHDVAFTGILKKVIGKKLGKKYRMLLPSVLAEIKRIAEQR